MILSNKLVVCRYGKVKWVQEVSKYLKRKKYLESIFNDFRKNNVIKYYKCDKSSR